MGCRRRASHRSSFLTVTAAENTADAQALKRRVRRAIQEAEVLDLPAVREHLDEALSLLARHVAKDTAVADEAAVATSVGQHEPVA